MKQLVILGMGKSPTRFFLDNISNRLITDLTKKGITVTYYFLGNDVEKAQAQFDTIMAVKNYDAVMSFFYTDYAEVRTITDHSYMFMPNTASLAMIKVKHLRFNQGFNIQLFKADDITTAYWSSALNIDYDFRDPILYTRISKKILTSLKKNNITN